MLKSLLILVLVIVLILALLVFRSSSGRKQEEKNPEAVDPDTLVRMRTAPGAQRPVFVVPEEPDDSFYEAPDPRDYIDETPVEFQEPSLYELLIDENVPRTKKEMIAEELRKLGYVIRFPNEEADGPEDAVFSEEVPAEEAGSLQMEDAMQHPELADPEDAAESLVQRKKAFAAELQRLVSEGQFPPELAIQAARYLEADIVLPESDDIQENYDRADALLNKTDISQYSFDMFSDFCHEAVGRKHLEDYRTPEENDPVPGTDVEPVEHTFLPEADMSADIGWDI